MTRRHRTGAHPGDLEAMLARFVGPSAGAADLRRAQARRAPLYKLARAGLTVRVRRAPSSCSICHSLTSPPGGCSWRPCSKGTYIRALAEDIAAALGTAGHVAALRRLWVEPFADDPMHTLEALHACQEAGGTLPLLPLDRPLQHLPELRLNAEEARAFGQGRKCTERTERGTRARARL